MSNDVTYGVGVSDPVHQLDESWDQPLVEPRARTISVRHVPGCLALGFVTLLVLVGLGAASTGLIAAHYLAMYGMLAISNYDLLVVVPVGVGVAMCIAGLPIVRPWQSGRSRQRRPTVLLAMSAIGLVPTAFFWCIATVLAQGIAVQTAHWASDVSLGAFYHYMPEPRLGTVAWSLIESLIVAAVLLIALTVAGRRIAAVDRRTRVTMLLIVAVAVVFVLGGVFTIGVVHVYGASGLSMVGQ